VRQRIGVGVSRVRLGYEVRSFYPRNNGFGAVVMGGIVFVAESREDFDEVW